jgi:NADPH:quinone reductase-like Zn-dependent oxidoreductase
VRAFAIDCYKGEIQTRTFPDPLPGPSEVIVATAAASVNPYDAKLRDGAFKAIIPARCR